MEEWRAVEGFPGYEVSSLGRLRSWLKLPNERLPPTEPRVLKGGRDKDGYRRAVLCRPGRRASLKIHALVLAAFCPPRPSESSVARHLDGNPLNNAATNLTWGTQAENIADRDRHGTTRRKLSAEDKAEIVRLKGSEPQAMTAARFGVTPHTVWVVQTGYVWQGKRSRS